MGTGYTRQAAADIVDGNIIEAPPLNAEFNQIQAFAHGTTGHAHDGTSGNGPKINLNTSVTGTLPTANGGIGGINNLSATTNPTVNDDANDGYVVGSKWVNVTQDRIYEAVDVTVGAAIWRRMVYYETGTTTILGSELGTSASGFTNLNLTSTGNGTGIQWGSGTDMHITTNLLGTTMDIQATAAINFSTPLFSLPLGHTTRWDAGDVTLIHSANTLAFAGASTGYTFANGPITPAANDGIALGTTSLQFSDLFLASGAVIGFNNNDVLITHSSNLLTFSGAVNGYSFDANLLLPTSGSAINFASGDVLITHGSNTLSFTGAGSGYSFDALVIAPRIKSAVAVSVADDAAVDLGAMANTRELVLIWARNAGTTPVLAGLFYVNTSGAPEIVQIAGPTTNVVTTTSNVTGTTGVDGNWTISATSGSLKVENRTGSSKSIAYQLFA